MPKPMVEPGGLILKRVQVYCVRRSSYPVGFAHLPFKQGAQSSKFLQRFFAWAGFWRKFKAGKDSILLTKTFR